jgi:hypothetical protein
MARLISKALHTPKRQCFDVGSPAAAAALRALLFIPQAAIASAQKGFDGVRKSFQNFSERHILLAN